MQSSTFRDLARCSVGSVIFTDACWDSLNVEGAGHQMAGKRALSGVRDATPKDKDAASEASEAAAPIARRRSGPNPEDPGRGRRMMRIDESSRNPGPGLATQIDMPNPPSANGARGSPTSTSQSSLQWRKEKPKPAQCGPRPISGALGCSSAISFQAAPCTTSLFPYQRPGAGLCTLPPPRHRCPPSGVFQS